MVLNASDVEVVAGKVDINKFETSKVLMHRHHCADCGVALWFSSPGYEGIVALKPGTLDDTSSLRPIAHMWVRSAQPWVSIPGDMPAFQEQPTLAELLEIARKAYDA